MQMLNLEKDTSVDTKEIDPNGGSPSYTQTAMLAEEVNFTQKIERNRESSQKFANLDILLKQTNYVAPPRIKKKKSLVYLGDTEWRQPNDEDSYQFGELAGVPTAGMIGDDPAMFGHGRAASIPINGDLVVSKKKKGRKVPVFQGMQAKYDLFGLKISSYHYVPTSQTATEGSAELNNDIHTSSNENSYKHIG